jgi:hypothetical protein
VNYTAMEDILEGKLVLTGMFSLNGHHIVILFDSGATPDWISKACTQTHQLDIQHSNTPYLISTLGGKVVTRHIARQTPHDLVGKVYKVCLIVLDGQGIDVILGMGWMREHRALLDTAVGMVYLDSPTNGVVALQLSVASAAPPVHHTTAQNLEDIPIACEFPEVFPDYLSGIPPDREVEFTIEL